MKLAMFPSNPAVISVVLPRFHQKTQMTQQIPPTTAGLLTFGAAQHAYQFSPQTQQTQQIQHHHLAVVAAVARAMALAAALAVMEEGTAMDLAAVDLVAELVAAVDVAAGLALLMAAMMVKAMTGMFLGI